MDRVPKKGDMVVYVPTGQVMRVEDTEDQGAWLRALDDSCHRGSTIGYLREATQDEVLAAKTAAANKRSRSRV